MPGRSVVGTFYSPSTYIMALYNIYAIKNKDDYEYLYIGYYAEGNLLPLRKAAARFINCDVHCLIIQQIETHTHRIPGYIVDMYRYESGLIDVLRHPSGATKIDKDFIPFEIELPVIDKKVIYNRKRYEEVEKLKRALKPKVQTKDARFILVHRQGDVNGFVRYTLDHTNYPPTYKVSIEIP